MNFDSLTDGDISALIQMPKRVVNPSAKWRAVRGSRQKSHKVQGEDRLFQLFLRQNEYDQRNFCCGLSVVKPDSQHLILLRYNGANHPHGDIEYACHIHRATESAITAGLKAESFAAHTDEYSTLDGALFCVCRDANIEGLAGLKPDQPGLFNHREV